MGDIEPGDVHPPDEQVQQEVEEQQQEAEEDEQQQHHQLTGDIAASSGHHYSIYEPHYQQMHPLIYYEEPAYHLHNHHPHILGPGAAHNWDSEQMPMMIPYGDTSNPVEDETTIQATTQTTQQTCTSMKISLGPVPTNRELHNEIERRRRSRIKNCCEVLRDCKEFKCKCENWMGAE